MNSGGNPRVLEDPGHIQLRGPVRQVVTSTVQGESKISSLPPSLLLVQLATITPLHIPRKPDLSVLPSASGRPL